MSRMQHIYDASFSGRNIGKVANGLGRRLLYLRRQSLEITVHLWGVP